MARRIVARGRWLVPGVTLTQSICLAAALASTPEQDIDRQRVTRDPATLQVQVRTAQGEKPPSPARIQLLLGNVLLEDGDCDALGNYTFRYLESGHYTLQVSLPGFEAASQKVRVRPGGNRRIVVRLGELEKAPFDPASREYWREGNAEVREEVTKARQLRLTGDPAGAISHLRRALEMDPRFSVAHGELGLCYVRLSLLDEARASFEAAIEHGPKSLTPYLNLAEVLRQQGDLEAAQNVLNRASEIYPDRGEPDYHRARIQFDSGEIENATSSALRAAARDHFYVAQVHLLLADIYERRGELYRVPKALEAYLTQNPTGQDIGSVQARLEKVRAELKSMEISTKRYSELIDRYRSGRFMDAAAALSQLPREVTYQASRFYQKDPLTDGEILTAALLHTDAALVSEDERSFHFLTASEYLGQIKDEARRRSAARQWHLAVAYHFQSRQRYLMALPFLTQVAQQFPDDIEILIAAGNACEAAGWIYGYANLIDRAVGVYRRVLVAEPEHVEAHLRLAHVLKLKGLLEESQQELKWTLAHSEDPEIVMVANLLLGDIHRAAGDLQDAIECYRKAVEIAPGCPMAATAQSHALHLAGDTAASHQALKRLAEKGNGRASEKARGWWRYLLGHSEDSEKMMAQLREGIRR